MAGAIADRELGTRFAVATPADDAAIRRLLRENPMRGSVDLTFEREPGYFAGADLAGGQDQTITAFSGNDLVCMGRCSLRDCWVDGAVRRVGYLAELRLDAAARGRFRVLREGYEFFHALQRENPADLYFTSIAADNERARRVLESGLRGLPSYRFLGELDTLLVTVPRRARPSRLELERVTPATLPAWLDFVNSRGRAHQVATVWTNENVRTLAAQGFPLDRLFLARKTGEIVAGGALWDQRGFRQTVVRGYSAALAAVRPLVNLAGRIFGTPRLPAIGAALAHGFLSPLACAESPPLTAASTARCPPAAADPLLPDVIEAAFPLAAEARLQFLTVALPSADPRLRELRRRFSTRTYRSRLYRVDWPDLPAIELRDQRLPFLPDVALL
jgi:hypothetical protein